MSIRKIEIVLLDEEGSFIYATVPLKCKELSEEVVFLGHHLKSQLVYLFPKSLKFQDRIVGVGRWVSVRELCSVRGKTQNRFDCQRATKKDSTDLDVGRHFYLVVLSQVK